jgi:hypothetical protein
MCDCVSPNLLGNGSINVLLAMNTRNSQGWITVPAKTSNNLLDLGLDFKELECGYMDSINSAQNRNRWRILVGTLPNLQVL